MDVDLRTAMGRLTSGVSVVAARAGRHDVAITVTSLVSVSLEPPSVLVTVHRDARLREAVDVGAGWAISVLGARGRAAAAWLAEPGRPLLDQLTRVPHRAGDLTGAAILDAATAWLEVRTTQVVEVGTHDVVVAEVLASGVHEGESGSVLHSHGRLETYRDGADRGARGAVTTGHVQSPAGGHRTGGLE